MAKMTVGCEWCGKTVVYDTEIENLFFKCKKCNAKLAVVEQKHCYEEIADILKKGKWCVGKRIIYSFGTPSEDYVIFTFLTPKSIRGTHSRESIDGALLDLFSTVHNKEDVNKFGFTLLQEMETTTVFSSKAHEQTKNI